MNAQISEKFQEWLKETPEVLVKFMEIIKLWYESQGQLPAPVSNGPPQDLVPGGETALVTGGISNEDLNALYHGYAEAIVKEKAAEYIKGFVAGVMVGSGF